MNEPIQEGKPIYVFQLPIRIWHWSMVLSFLVLIPTGYIIGKPWHSLDGDPTYLFYMGYTRMAHFIAGFIITIGLLWRIIFAFFGNKYSSKPGTLTPTGVSQNWPWLVAGCAALLIAAAFVFRSLRKKEGGAQ